MIDTYDIKSKSTKTVTTPDGMSIISWGVKETRKIDVRPFRFGWDRSAHMDVELGGVKYTPNFVGWISNESIASAADKITADSGTTDFMVLRVYNYESHIEMDLVKVQ